MWLVGHQDAARRGKGSRRFRRERESKGGGRAKGRCRVPRRSIATGPLLVGRGVVRWGRGDARGQDCGDRREEGLV
jgi:hypothetical protein